jgi:hypothetical protein
MENDLYTFRLCRADWERVIQALRNEAFNLTQESNRACEKGSRDYGTLLWEETAILNAIASDIDFILPEND